MLSLVQLYRLLLEAYGYQNWWPVDENYHKTKGTDPKERLYGTDGSYEELKSYAEENIPRDLTIYKEFHALIDKHGQNYCRSIPQCGGCIIRNFCLSAIPSS